MITSRYASLAALAGGALLLCAPIARSEEPGASASASYDSDAPRAASSAVVPRLRSSEPGESTDEDPPVFHGTAVSSVAGVHDVSIAPAGASGDGTVSPRAALAGASGGGSVSPQATALPGGPSSPMGMGESFTAQLSTGTVGFKIPIKLLGARGGVQPALELSYTSSGGFGLAGKGWSVGAPAIQRQTDRGVPRYDDRPEWYPGQDRFIFGGIELVPICTVAGVLCEGVTGETMPAWASGWQYFRARVEGGFLRFFWSPDHLTWRVQSKDGGNFELGVPRDGKNYRGALDVNPDRPSEIYGWYLARQYDAEGGVNGTADPQPVNAIVYRYKTDGDVPYLTDIFDTSPAANPTSQDLSLYAHHTRIVYEARPDVVRSYRPGWLVEYRLRIARVDVTTKPFEGPASASRHVVRRYHLGYEEDSHTSLLTFVQAEGRCASETVEQADQTSPVSSCPRLPRVRLQYQRVSGAGGAPLRDNNGYAFEPFNETVKVLRDSPPHSLDESFVGMMDVNADGLADVVATAPGQYDGRHAVFFNGVTAGGKPGFSGMNRMSVQALDGVDASVLKFDNANVTSLDLDADGIVNMIHMPADKKYSVFSPVKQGTSWVWKGRAVETASAQDVKIDFTRNARNIRVMDVNADGLVDVVYSSPTELQTFYALGRYPGGNDQFGTAEWTGPDSATIRNDPVVKCAPWSSTAVRFSDPDVKIADMNGDGLADIVRIRSGQILYWPGRGNGFWGTGDRGGCAAGELASDRHIQMASAPAFGTAGPGRLLLNDVNADGHADLVEVHATSVDVYLNDGGLGWTARTFIENTPFLPNAAQYVQLTDVDGSGTPDILWGHAGEYQYIDLTGGVTPHLLVRIHNGLGATTELDYETTPELARAASAQGNPWESSTPTVSPVLVRSTVRDNLETLGRPAGAYVTEYSYRDPVYDGRQREFRGFREAIVKTIGDSNNPTSLQRTVFALGECLEAGVPCAPEDRWKDNHREALKGSPVLSEVFDEQGVYLTSEYQNYALRHLYQGRDGRRVIVAYPSQKNTFAYDTSSFDGVAGDAGLVHRIVVTDLTGAFTIERGMIQKRATAGTAWLQTLSSYDNFGNVTVTSRSGCIEGCPNGTDPTIAFWSEFQLPAGDQSGWLYRERRSFVFGSGENTYRNELLHQYNAQGKLVETKAVLSGTLPLDRFHASPVAPNTVAPPPPGASGGVSSPVQVVVATRAYDALGQMTSTRGANGRCSSTTFDAPYAHLPITSTSYVGKLGANGCGETLLTNTVVYDRGFGSPILSIDATGATSLFSYDEFGRAIAVYPQDPDGWGWTAHPALTVEYIDPDPDGTSVYSGYVTRTVYGPSFAFPSHRESRSFVDGLGRPLAGFTEADPFEGDAGAWVVAGAVELNAKGAPARVHAPWYYSGEPTPLALTPPAGPACRPRGSSYREYDAFGRTVTSYGADGLLEQHAVYHALSQDIYDAADLAAGPQQFTHVSVVSDGHGRGVKSTHRVRGSGAIEERHVLNEYIGTGQLRRSILKRAGTPDVVRWMQYDSFGRMVLNVEPNTSPNFNPDPTPVPATIAGLKAYRYAYNDAGDVVGVSDARGCGANYHYDTGGRLVAEDRSPCLPHHAPYSAPNLTTGDGTEAFYRYDTPDPDTESIVDAAGQFFGGGIVPQYLPGRAVSVSGLGMKTVFRYDAAGRSTGVAARLVKPGTPSTTLSSRYAPRWYTRGQTLDVRGGPINATTGVTTPELLGADGKSELTFSYDSSGLMRRIAGSYGTLLAGISYFADGSTDTITLGDGAATQRSFCYDVKGRVSTVQTYRAAPGFWTTPPAGSSYTLPGADTTQLSLEDYVYTYDTVGNVKKIEDFRSAADWPNAARPLTRLFEYDSLNRLTKTTYQYTGGGPVPWTSPFAAENAGTKGPPKPAPHVSFPNRVERQDFEYDWLGNPSLSTDDSQGFWDRSLGTTTVGSATSGPHQLRTASNRALAPASLAKGDLSVGYDAAGNMTGLVVRRDGACLPSAASCFQRFYYEWDEAGSLSRARRWDLTGSDRTTYGDVTSGLPTGPPSADLRYTYGAAGSRTLKTAVDAAGVARYTAYVFSTLELRGTSHDGTDYVLAPDKVQLTLPSGMGRARVLYSLESMPTLTSGQRHVFLEAPDHIGSTAFVIEHASGELVEYSAYQAYGAVDSDYRPLRWKEFREPHKFGGKEEDIEVGLAYFGARYYSPYLHLWLSPDPVTIHELGSDTNPYAYVHGSPLMGIDPDGREPLTILAAIGVSFLVAGGVDACIQASNVGWSRVKWGTDGVLGAAIIGAVAGGVSAGVGSLVSGAGAGQMVAGAASGVAGNLTSAALNYANSGQSGGLGEVLASGAVGGAVGGAIGGGNTASLGAKLGGAAAGSAAGFTTAAVFGADSPWQTLVLSTGGSVAEAAANHAIQGGSASEADNLHAVMAALSNGGFASEFALQGSLIDGGGAVAGPGGWTRGISQVAKVAKFVARMKAAYPQVVHPLGGNVPFPTKAPTLLPGYVRKTGKYADAYKAAWEAKHGVPEGGWSEYRIHHILPVRWGGTDALENLVHLKPGEHQKFSNFWNDQQRLLSAYSTVMFLDATGNGTVDIADIAELMLGSYVSVIFPEFRVVDEVDPI